MDNKKLIVANWKMNCNISDAYKLLEATNNINSNKEIIICPPFTLIYDLFKNHKHIIFGAQNCSEYEYGAFTGEVSARQLADIGCKYVIVGHSERRKYCSETNIQIKNKISQVISSGLKVILCVGENLNSREKHTYLEEIEKQIKESIPENIDTDNLIIAYEPVWSVGSGKVPNIIQIEEVNNFISQIFKNNISIIYGGSVSPKNINELLSVKLNSGVLIGGASLELESWQQIIN